MARTDMSQRHKRVICPKVSEEDKKDFKDWVITECQGCLSRVYILPRNQDIATPVCLSCLQLNLANEIIDNIEIN